jgi:putative tryptophan/tyrosine transport system substrate-binding protein
MKSEFLCWLLITVLLITASPAEAQQPKSISRIGFLSREIHPADSRAPVAPRIEVFRQGLQELGYLEGKNLLIEYRYADGRLERLPALAEELVRLKVEIIVTDTAHRPVPPRKQLRRSRS